MAPSPDYLTERDWSPEGILVRQTESTLETQAYHVVTLDDASDVQECVDHVKEQYGGIWNLYKLVREDVTKPLA